MTHELKTPISTISLATEGLLKKDIITKPKKLSQYSKIIFDENKRLGQHVERILKLSVMESGDIDLTVELIEAHQLIEDVNQIVKLQVIEKGGRLVTDLQAEYDQIEADYDHLKNVLINLIDNAIKYSINEPHIQISSSNTEHAFVLSVSDNGIGISRESQKMIFEKFYRVPTGNIHNVKGYGLGLSYVKAICDMLGATIQVQSEIEKGTTFTLTFPYRQQNQELN